jgi:hypothetical protein
MFQAPLAGGWRSKRHWAMGRFVTISLEIIGFELETRHAKNDGVIIRGAIFFHFHIHFIE